MKKTIVLICVIILFTAIGCGEDDNPTLGTEEQKALLSYNTVNLMDNGDQLLRQSMSSYTVLTNLSDAKNAEIKKVADYILFPFEDGSVDNSFSKRMATYMYADDFIIKTRQLMMGATNESTISQSVIGRSMSRGIFDSIGKFIHKVAMSFPIIGDVAEFMGFPTPEEIEQSAKMRPVYNQLKSIYGQNVAIKDAVDQMNKEMRANFSVLMGKTDQSLRDLSTIKGDLNILKQDVSDIATLINSSGMNQIMSSFKSFLTSYNVSGNQTAASNSVYEYFQLGEFWADVYNFIDVASNIQAYGRDGNTANGEYSDFIYDDTETGTNVRNIYPRAFYFLGYQGSESYTDKYVNSKRQMVMGLGDLEYLSKMFLTRLKLNSVLYSGDDLKQNNTVIAQTCLDLLQSSGINSSVQNALNHVSTIYNARVSNLTSYYTKMSLHPEYTHVDPQSGAFIQSGVDVIWQALWVNGTFTGGLQDGLDIFTNDHQNALDFYLTIYMAKLLALETQIRSYM